MHATLTTITFDPLGVVTLRCLPKTTAGETRRRVNRIATLDGGAVLNDFGQSEADRTIELRWRPTGAETESAVERLVKLYAQLHIATPSGCWLVAPEAYTPGASESRLVLLVVRKTSED